MEKEHAGCRVLVWFDVTDVVGVFGGQGHCQRLLECLGIGLEASGKIGIRGLVELGHPGRNPQRVDHLLEVRGRLCGKQRGPVDRKVAEVRLVEQAPVAEGIGTTGDTESVAEEKMPIGAEFFGLLKRLRERENISHQPAI